MVPDALATGIEVLRLDHARHGLGRGRRGGAIDGSGCGGRQRVHVRAGVLAIGPGSFVGARGGQPIVAAGEIHKPDIVERKREVVPDRVQGEVRAGQDVLGDDRAGKIDAQGIEAHARAGAGDPKPVVGRNVVAKHQAGARRAIGKDDVFGLERGVVVDRHIGGAREQLQQPASAPRPAQIVKQIVLDQDAFGLLAEVVVVIAQNVDPLCGMAQDVIAEGHVFHRRPGRRAVGIAHGKEDREAILVGWPVVLEEIAVDEHSAGVLQLEEVLDGPLDAGIARIADAPGQWLEEVVVPDFNIGRHEIDNLRIHAPKHHILPGSLEIVVHDLEGTGAVPAKNRLPFHPHLVKVRQIRIDDGGARAVDGEPAPDVAGRRAMQIAPVKDQICGHLAQRGLPALRLEPDQIVQSGGGRRLGAGNFDPHESVVMRRRIGRDGCGRIGCDDLGHETRRGRRHTGAGGGETGVG